MKRFGTCLLVLGVSIGKGLHLSVSSNSSVSSKEGPLCLKETSKPPGQEVMAKGKGFLPMLNALPKRTLTKKEVDTFKRDGVLLLRAVVPDRELLQRLKDSVVKEGTYQNATDGFQPWDSAEVALGLESTLMADLAASVYEVPGPICIDKAQHFEMLGAETLGPRRGQKFHVDKGEPTDAQVAIWLSLSDAKYPLDYLRGSNHFRTEIVAACHLFEPEHPAFNDFKAGCGEQYEENLTRYLGYPSLWSTEVAAGDVLIHDGNVAHRGMQAHDYRLALAFRYNLPHGAQRPTDFDRAF